MESSTTPGHESGSASLEELLKENLVLAKENNHLLHSMRRVALWSFIVKTVIWLLVLGVPLLFLGSYLQPLLNAFSGTASSTSPKGPGGVFGLPSGDDIQKAVEQYKVQYKGK